MLSRGTMCFGGMDSDRLYDGQGNDIIVGGGDEYLSGENENNKLYGGNNVDILYGGRILLRSSYPE
jgi:serralysin